MNTDERRSAFICVHPRLYLFLCSVFDELLDQFLCRLADLFIHTLQLERADRATAPDYLIRSGIDEINHQGSLRVLVHADVPATKPAWRTITVILHAELVLRGHVVRNHEVSFFCFHPETIRDQLRFQTSSNAPIVQSVCGERIRRSASLDRETERLQIRKLEGPVKV